MRRDEWFGQAWVVVRSVEIMLSKRTMFMNLDEIGSWIVLFFDG